MEFAASSEKIATNILSDRLSNLEKSGGITKGKLPGNKKTNIYALTEKGITFLPVLMEVVVWSYVNLREHITESTVQLAEAILRDKVAFADSMSAKLKQELQVKE